MTYRTDLSGFGNLAKLLACLKPDCSGFLDMLDFVVVFHATITISSLFFVGVSIVMVIKTNKA